jgi:hypothetical protein
MEEVAGKRKGRMLDNIVPPPTGFVEPKRKKIAGSLLT